MPKPSPRKHGGPRPGSGPKLGSKNASTLDKEAARGAYQEWMSRKMGLLMSAQFVTATGVSQFVLREPNGRFKVLDDPDELRAKVEEGAVLEIFTRLPNAQAQSDILNRLMDKPKEQEQDVAVRGEMVIRWQ